MTKEILVIGHKNPDTDSICSALAYANLKNNLGKDVYRAGRVGEINKETEFVLDYFGLEQPILVNNVGCLVADAMSEEPKTLDQDAPLKEISGMIKESSSRFVCIVDNKHHLKGVVTVSDLAKRYLEELTVERFEDLPLTVNNVLTTLNGQLIVDNGATEIRGNVLIGAMDPQTMMGYIEKGDILITGDRENAHIQGLKAGIACLIVTGGGRASQSVLDLAKERHALVINTPCDTFAAARLLNMSIPVKQIMSREIVTFHPGELLKDAKEVMLEKSFRSYPVVNDNGHLLGLISPEDFLRAQRKKVVLMDHNERGQAVEGLDEAEIVELIDHHRLGDIQTGNPIFFRNEPVGSTSTIVASLYEEMGMEIKREMAGIMLSAILSDTLMFKSPTSTPKDKKVAEKLALLAQVEIEAFAREMFKAGSDFQGQGAEEIVNQDFKDFSFGDAKVGIGQVNCMDLSVLEDKKEELFQVLANLKDREGYFLTALMLTNILEESTELIFVGDEKVITQAYQGQAKSGSIYLPGVVSRKKQIVPPLSKVI